jgi:branched-chain amino acid transport system ATP-binding protein
MIEVVGLNGYRGSGQVVRDVDFGVGPGEIVGMLGRNGMGKTSSLLAILGLIRREGRILLDGRDVSARSPQRLARSGIAFVPQGRGLFSTLTVRENLDLAWHARGALPSSALEEAIAYFEPLRNLLDRYAATLSGGEQQMVAVARALLNRPKVILLDEPTEGLAPLFVEKVGAIIRAVAGKGVGVLLVEQNLRFALSVGQRVLFVEKGTIARACSIEEARSPEILHRYLAVAS